MSRSVEATPAEVDAAQYLVERARARGETPRWSMVAIANAVLEDGRYLVRLDEPEPADNPGA